MAPEEDTEKIRKLLAEVALLRERLADIQRLCVVDANEAPRDAGIKSDEAAVRRFVSDRWADDWDSDEDAAYDDKKDTITSERGQRRGSSSGPWRVGRKVGRTIYDANDQLIGVMDTVDDAGRVVGAVDEIERLTEQLSETFTLAVDWQDEAKRLRKKIEQHRDIKHHPRCNACPQCIAADETLWDALDNADG